MSDDDATPETPETTGRNQAGRFAAGQSGNPNGRPTGVRHAALVALDAIGEEEGPEIMQSVVAAAKKGDMRAADILLRRIWPERKGRPVTFAMPAIETAADLGAAMAAIIRSTADGELTPDEATSYASLIETRRRTIETVEHVQQIAELQARIAALGHAR